MVEVYVSDAKNAVIIIRGKTVGVFAFASDVKPIRFIEWGPNLYDEEGDADSGTIFAAKCKLGHYQIFYDEEEWDDEERVEEKDWSSFGELGEWCDFWGDWPISNIELEHYSCECRLIDISEGNINLNSFVKVENLEVKGALNESCKRVYRLQSVVASAFGKIEGIIDGLMLEN